MIPTQKIKVEELGQFNVLEWVRCRNCPEEWTSRSINKYGLCPKCEKKALGIWTNNDEICKILQDYHCVNLQWDGKIWSMPDNIKRELWFLFHPIIEKKSEYNEFQ